MTAIPATPDRPAAPDHPATQESGDAVPVDVLGARICGLASRMAQATYELLRMIAEFDERQGWAGVGIRSCAHWLSWTCSMTAGTAREHVRVARALRGLPLVSAEMAAGRLSYSKVREMTRVAGKVDEAQLVELARVATASQLARSLRGFRRADADRASQEQRRFARWHTTDDGSVLVTVRVPAEEGAVLVAALNAASDDLARIASKSEDRGEAEDRSEAEDRATQGPDCSAIPVRPPVENADAVLHWARGYLAATPKDRSGEDRATVVVHVAAEHLVEGAADPAQRSRGNASPADPALDPAPDPAPDDIDRTAIRADTCQIRGIGGITPTTAARLACDATIVGIVRGAGGVVLAHGRRRRVVSAAQRRLLSIRDGGCQFPSCARVSHLEAHHVRHWSHGGATDPDNLILLCRFHHVACHEGGVSITATADSTRGIPCWQFTTRRGDPLISTTAPEDAVGPRRVRPGPKHDFHLLWHDLDGSRGWNDPEARRIRPLWAGERFSLADTVSMLFAIKTGDTPTDHPGHQPAAA